MADDQEPKTEETPKAEAAGGETVKEEASQEDSAKVEAPKEKTPKAEAAKVETPKETSGQSEPAAKKKKKINKLSLDEINRRIGEMENAAHIHSKYYRHLQNRKNELQSQ